LATKKKKKKAPTAKTGSAKAGTAKRRAPAKKAESAADVARKTALAVASAALDNKAANVEIIDVRGKVDYADYVVIMSGRSDRHVSALARNIEDALRLAGQRCLGIEGLPKASWLLLDFGDVIVHVFHHDMRGYYDLERLWIDAARVAVEGA
jgi:ribosome-associated protein